MHAGISSISQLLRGGIGSGARRSEIPWLFATYRC
jgi:hypothetical protein